jgi:multiple sugar transport system substrate-binding protein
LTGQVNFINSHYRNYITLYLKIALFTILCAAFLGSTGCQGFNPAELTPLPPPTSAVEIIAISTVPPSPAPSPIPTLTPEPTSAILIDAEALRGLQLNFWAPQFEDWMPGAGGSLLQEMVDEFNRQNEWGIQIQTTTFENYESLYGSIQSAFQAEFPDLLLGYPFQSAGLDRGARPLVDLDFYVEDPVWGIPAGELDFYPAFWEGEMVEGKRLGIPFYRLGQVLYYNATWARELGFENPPDTPDQLKNQVCTASAQVEGQPRGMGGWSISAEAPSVLSWIYAFGGEVVKPGHRPYTFDSREGDEAFTYVKGLHSQGCAWLERDRSPGEDFATRNALVISGSLVGAQSLEAALRDSGSQDQWAALTFPSPSGNPGLAVYGPSLSIVETTGEKQFAAWLFIRWLVEPENQARLVQATGAFPTRLSAQEHLASYREAHPKWADAQDLLQYARPEPVQPSWGLVRWAVSDAAGFLFSPFFAPGEVGKLLEELDQTAAELHYQRR